MAGGPPKRDILFMSASLISITHADAVQAQRLRKRSR
jgi:hypothetical protein